MMRTVDEAKVRLKYILSLEVKDLSDKEIEKLKIEVKSLKNKIGFMKEEETQ